jgi:hypothetical protein
MKRAVFSGSRPFAIPIRSPLYSYVVIFDNIRQAPCLQALRFAVSVPGLSPVEYPPVSGVRETVERKASDDGTREKVPQAGKPEGRPPGAAIAPSNAVLEAQNRAPRGGRQTHHAKIMRASGRSAKLPRVRNLWPDVPKAIPFGTPFRPLLSALFGTAQGHSRGKLLAHPKTPFSAPS